MPTENELGEIFRAPDETGWLVFREKFSASVLHTLSRVGFSNDGNVGVYFAVCSRDWLHGWGRFFVVRKKDGRWDVDPSIQIGWSWMALNMPNKAPEPTPGLVTPRALVRVFKMKRWNEERNVARGAPSPGVAHL
jgi:hypothetical protein